MIDYNTYQMDEHKNVLVIEVTGELDADSSEYLMECVQSEIDAGARKIVLDCSKLTYITSLGLGTLVRASLRIRKLDGTVVLAGVQGMVAELLQVVQLGRLMNMYPDVAKAGGELASL